MLRVCAAFHDLRFLQTTHLLSLMGLLFVLSVLILFALVEYSKLEQGEFGATIHASFTDVSLFRSIVLDESNSDAPSIRLSMTNVVAKD